MKETPINVIVQFANSQNISDKKGYKIFKRSTGLSISPRFWNSKSYKISKTFEKYDDYNIKLIEIESFFNNLYEKCRKEGLYFNLEFLGYEYDKFIRGGKAEKLSFFEYFDNFIKTLPKKSFSISLNQTVKLIKKFSSENKYYIDFDSINMEFYELFVKFLKINNYSKNTIGKHIKNTKYLLNNSLTKNLHTNIIFKSSNFKVTTEQVDKIYLNEKEISKIFNLDLSQDLRLERVRDLFLIGCYTGLRFSDFSQIQPENINKEKTKIKIRTQKTGAFVEIPLKMEAKYIIEKYNSSIPNAITNQKMNQYLKEIGELAQIDDIVYNYTKGKNSFNTSKGIEKYNLICTHTARRSFATNCYLAGIPPIAIMRITGHKTETEFMKYIKISNEQNADFLLEHDYFKHKPVL